MPDDVRLDGLSIHLNEDGKKVIAYFTPEESSRPITSEIFKNAITSAGFGAYCPDEAGIQRAVTKFCAGETFTEEVAIAVDGSFGIQIDDNRLHAYLTCVAPKGGAPVTMSRILEEAKKMEITVRLDLAAIKDAVLNYGSNVLIAAGKTAVDGIDGSFEILLPAAKERTPFVDENGLADFRELGEIFTVDNGAPLMRSIPATSGDPGVDVLGRLIPAKAGKSVPFAAKLEGSMLDPGDPNLLVAAISGCPVVQKNAVAVEPLYKVNSVDMSVGNIDFSGSVHVKGDVCSGMTVKATGDIRVDGAVEGAKLVAGGDIEVKGGIFGQTEKDEKFHATITSKGSCSAHFAQNAHITAGTGIFIQEVAMQCELVAGHQIIVGDKPSNKGHIAGGSARAPILVKARVFGASSHAKTIITVGPDRKLHSRLVELAKLREEAQIKRADVVKLLEMARLAPGRIPAEKVAAVQSRRDFLDGEIENIATEERALHKELELCAGAQIIAEKHFLEGVEVCCGSQCHRIVDDRDGGMFQLRGNDFSFREPTK